MKKNCSLWRVKAGPKSKSNWIRNCLDAFFLFKSLLNFQKYVYIFLHFLNKSIQLFFFFQCDIFYFKVDLFWEVRKLAKFPHIKTFHSGLNKILGACWFFFPFCKEVYSSLGATRMDFIYSFEVHFRHGTGKNRLHNLHSNDFQPTFTFHIKVSNPSHGFGI